MTKIYRSLLKLYPREHRSVFADEMLTVFRDAQADAWQGRTVESVAFYLREISGLLGGAAHERIREFYASRPIKGGTMDERSRCRFPRFAIVMMTIVFLIVVEIIAKGEGLSHYLFRMYTVSGQHIAGAPEHWDLGKSFQHWPSRYGLLSGALVGFLIAWAAGVTAWVIAYLLRRTGAQRLEQFPSWPSSR